MYEEERSVTKGNSKYLSNDVKSEIKQMIPGSAAILNAPTGAGKTTFIVRELLNSVRCRGNKKILLLVNRISLKSQVFRELCEMQSIDVNQLSFDCSGYVRVGALVLMSLQYLATRLSDGIPCNRVIGPFRTDQYEYVVLDEAHVLVADALFSERLNNIVDYLPKAFNTAVRLYVSATTEPIRNLILEMEKVIDRHEGNSKDYIDLFGVTPRYMRELTLYGNAFSGTQVKADFAEFYGAIPDYSYFTYRIMSEGCSLADDINEQAEQGILRKALVFVSSIEEGVKLKEHITPTLSTAFICSSTNRKYQMDENDYAVLNTLETKQIISSDILIATKAIDNGISVLDDVTHVYIEGTDYISAVQEAGRIRVKPQDHQKVELVIRHHEPEFFHKRLWSLKQQKSLIRRIETATRSNDLQALLSMDIDNVRNMISYDANRRLYIGRTAKYALDYYISDLEDTISRLENDPNGYVKKVLSWFSFEYDAELDASVQAKNAVVQEIRDLFTSYAGKANGEEDFETMRFRLKAQMAALGIDLTHGHPERSIGIKTVKDKASEYGFSFEGTRNSWTIKEEC